MTTLSIGYHVTLAKETIFSFKIFYVTHTATYNDTDSLSFLLKYTVNINWTYIISDSALEFYLKFNKSTFKSIETIVYDIKH